MKLGSNSTLISAYTALVTVAVGFMAYEALRPEPKMVVSESAQIESVHETETEGSAEEVAEVSKGSPRIASH